MKKRIYAIQLLQRSLRMFKAFRVAFYLRQQKNSEWEQLWDNKRNCFYFYNYVTKTSQYEDPGVSFRPLIRDLYSAQLIQAWPDLDSHKDEAEAIIYSKKHFINALCNICKTRKCVRICNDCIDESNQFQGFGYPYCYTCFLKEHPAYDEDKSNHNFEVVPEEEKMLICVKCGDYATRKCLGMILDGQIEMLCSDLSRYNTERWFDILKRLEIWGENRICLLFDEMKFDQIADEAGKKSAVQYVRNQLERVRTECDDCYCMPCYNEFHSKGKRSRHYWKGFKVNAQICEVCNNSPAEFSCVECQCIYCESCNKVFHGMGRKRKHKREIIYENLDNENLGYCEICHRRVANTSCENELCSSKLCDSCYEFHHKPICKASRVYPGSTESSSAKETFPGQTKLPISTECVSCGRKAIVKCVQCGDLYCDPQDNDSCFKRFHSKGKRKLHRTEPVKIYRLLNEMTNKK